MNIREVTTVVKVWEPVWTNKCVYVCLGSLLHIGVQSHSNQEYLGGGRGLQKKIIAWYIKDRVAGASRYPKQLEYCVSFPIINSTNHILRTRISYPCNVFCNFLFFRLLRRSAIFFLDVFQ